MPSGTLTLIPTPIDEESPLEPRALARLLEACQSPDQCLMAVEEHKSARRRWLSWGLPREAIERFREYNEHGPGAAAQGLLAELKAGKDVFLMSDGGLPAFCDPGVELVDACHHAKVPVTSTPFPHAPALAVALSGFRMDRYLFAGFPPREGEARGRELAALMKAELPTLLMETPYRLKRLLEELSQAERPVFVAMDLNAPTQRLWRGSASELGKLTEGLQKAEPVVILGPRAGARK